MLAGKTVGIVMKSLCTAGIALFLSAGSVAGADFRLMHIDEHNAHVVDLSTIKDERGPRHVVMYSVTDKPLPAANIPGKFVTYAAFYNVLNCKSNEMRLEKLIVYDSNFTEVDRLIPPTASWNTVTTKSKIASEWGTFCAASPRSTATAPRLAARDWSNALIEARVRLLRGH